MKVMVEWADGSGVSVCPQIERIVMMMYDGMNSRPLPPVLDDPPIGSEAGVLYLNPVRKTPGQGNRE